mmetsp:Transcript_58028/g.127240  ORF Transcript_58028/g.127240 Transcript_58028/m.127240 type:complete len:202 (+) Transcript_58028:408-1013(+)
MARARRLGHLVPLGIEILHPGHAEVGDLDDRLFLWPIDFLREQQIQGLKIPVNDLGLERVQVAHGTCDVETHLMLLLPHKLHILVPVQELETSLALTELSDHAEGLFSETDPIEPHEVRVIDPRHHGDLPCKRDLLLQLSLLSLHEDLLDGHRLAIPEAFEDLGSGTRAHTLPKFQLAEPDLRTGGIFPVACAAGGRGRSV